MRVRNCDFLAGFEFFILLPIPTALYGSAVGLVANRLYPNLKGAKKFGLGVALLLTPLLVSLWGLYAHPPIFVWDHLWGYFSGSIYDEGIQVDSRLLLFRGVTLSRIFVLIFALSLWETRNATVLWLPSEKACVISNPRQSLQIASISREKRTSSSISVTCEIVVSSA